MKSAEEEAAAPFLGGAYEGAPGSGTGTSASIQTQTSDKATPAWDQIKSVVRSVVNAISTIKDYATIAASIVVAASMKAGSRYLGQVKIFANKWVRWLAGVSKNLTHIKASNMLRHMGRRIFKLPILSKIPQGISDIKERWAKHQAEYDTMDTPRRLVAKTVDAIVAEIPSVSSVLGGVAGLSGGATLGAAAGSPGGPAGAAGGALIVGNMGRIAGEEIGEKLGNTIVDKIDSSGLRNRAIDFLTEHIGNPIARGISDAQNILDNFSFEPDPIPAFGFNF